jgi:lipopolysaccharide export system permease protein
MFTDLNDGMTIYVAEKDDLTGRITDVSIVEKEKAGELSPRVTTAEWGRVITDRESDAMVLELHDGEIHEMPDPEQPHKYQVIRFRQHDIRMTDMERDIKDSRRKSRGDREMNLTDLSAAAARQHERLSESAQHVSNLNADVVRWQYRLLDAEEREKLRAREPANPAERRTRLSATRRKLEHASSQSRAQATVARSHVRKANKFMVEYHKKLAIPFACLVFALLGVPMAVTTSRSGKGVSVSLAMGVYLVYYLCLVGGEKLSDRGLLDPALSMWSGNLVLLAVGIPLFIRNVRETSYLELRWPWRRPAPPTEGATA